MRHDERDLILRMREGDDAAYEEVIRRHGPMLVSVARRLLRDPDDALDCFQEAMLRAFEKLDSFDGRSRLSTWLYRIVVNTCLMRLRAAKARPLVSIEELLPVFDSNDCRIESLIQPPLAETLLEREETRRVVRAAVDSLPDAYRTILVLRDFEELSTAEVAELLGIEPNNVKVRLHRARAALKKLLEPLWELNSELVPEVLAFGGDLE